MGPRKTDQPIGPQSRPQGRQVPQGLQPMLQGRQTQQGLQPRPQGPQVQRRITEQQQHQSITNALNDKTPEQKQQPKKYESMSNDELINFAFDTFKETYENKIKKTTINSIVHGEIISTNEDNIFVDTTTYEDPKFEAKCNLCNKKLYDYQINAIKKIRELELSLNHKSGDDLIKSNGWLLHLPIGSGKSLVFTFLALCYRVIPPAPIIISTSGINIPENEMIQLKYYPFYYENVGYIDGTEASITCIKDYIQRPMTVIITHYHLLEQLRMYITTDFKASLLKQTKIVFASTVRDIRVNCDILVVPAKLDIINALCALSYEQPFMRVIVDDYTNMPSIDQYRQIRATFTLFVSGSGFERDRSKIPPSYYTLRHIPVDKFSLVASVDETSKGILRSNVATFNILSSNTDFSVYKFVNEIDEYCLNRYKIAPVNLYKPIETRQGKLLDYFALSFLLKNIDKFNVSIGNIERDLAKNKIDENKVKWYLKWKKEFLNDQVKEISIDPKTNKQVIKMIKNPLRESLYTPTNNINQGIQTLIIQPCAICKSKIEHDGWGFISCCCGSFVCADCVKSITTHDLILMKCNTNNIITKFHDNNHYYCVVCHERDPVFVSNCTRNKKRTNIQTFHIVDDFMDTTDLTDSFHVDYYFKMFIDGLKPKYHDGRAIISELDEGNDLNNIFTFNEELKDGIVKKLYPKDRLALSCLDRINETLKRLEINPSKMNSIKPNLLIYDCPDYIQRRFEDYFKTGFSNNPKSNLYEVGLMFKRNLGELIGLHQNILGIIIWQQPGNVDEIQQLIGRIVRLNNWNNPIYFYITCTDIVGNDNERSENDHKPEPKLGGDVLGYLPDM